MHYTPFLWLVGSLVATGALAGEKPTGLPPIPPVGEASRMQFERRGLPIKLDPSTLSDPPAILSTSTLPYKVLAPATTPVFVLPAAPVMPPVSDVATYLPATSAALTSDLYITATQMIQNAKTLSINGVIVNVGQIIPNALCALDNSCTSPTQSTVDKMVKAYGAKNCLDSSTNDTVTNSPLKCTFAASSALPQHHMVEPTRLCTFAQVPEVPHLFHGQKPSPSTRGAATDSSRATIVVVVKGNTQSTAIYGVNVGSDGCAISNIQIDGSRPALGWISAGQALIEMGGTNMGHVISNIRAFEPRGWSVLHLIEGADNACFGAKVLNSQIRPAGPAPSGTSQFRRRNHHKSIHNLKRDSTGTYPAGQWADGISLACSGSVVQGNTITDAIDGGIVIFQAPGSLVSNNRIITDDRQLLGGYQRITNNVLDARNSMMKIGIAIGPLSWQTYNTSYTRTFDGVFSSNQFSSSGPKRYFGYGVTVAGYTHATVQGNSFNAANFGGTVGASCDPGIPAFGPMWRNPYTIRNTGPAFDERRSRVRRRHLLPAKN
ncbi:BQ2448_226 [Microbotryum intermedium]|uniref:BQ2448_226 protein n=1 Tax=Microbotryum intermedium TaxID=269621 RepID=A0A238F4Z3_9BASI|nr:BQ2448_226 [Microbotryum intermedium]